VNQFKFLIGRFQRFPETKQGQAQAIFKFLIGRFQLTERFLPGLIIANSNSSLAGFSADLNAASPAESIIQIPHWPVSALQNLAHQEQQNEFKFLIGRFQRCAKACEGI